MEYQEISIYETSRMYCPSTNETVFEYGSEELDAGETLKGYWHSEELSDPEIYDENLESAWDEYSSKEDDYDGDIYDYGNIEKFLMEYQNDKWKVICGLHHGLACGPVGFYVYFVVLKDTIVDESPD